MSAPDDNNYPALLPTPTPPSASCRSGPVLRRAIESSGLSAPPPTLHEDDALPIREATIDTLPAEQRSAIFTPLPLGHALSVAVARHRRPRPAPKRNHRIALQEWPEFLSILMENVTSLLRMTVTRSSARMSRVHLPNASRSSPTSRNRPDITDLMRTTTSMKSDRP
eukprot:CCRYP_007316-RA/>CCRYP_007316-RA protein AED:0.41 eAED:0.39 QI:0/0/0/1/1/1/2/0/166